MLDPLKLKRAEEIFQVLVELPSDRRAQVWGDRRDIDDETRSFVEQLLANDESGMGGFMQSPVGLAGPARSSDFQAPLPERVGEFRIIRRIGEGGMGVVFEAEQANPRRIVALKVIRGGRFIDEYSIRLFQREIEALARLRHPGVAAIYEAGRTDDGQHYFAMEYVAGMPMLQYVRERRVAVRERLELFRKVCDAIHSAHQRGVMHRDLKPANILVVEDETEVRAASGSERSASVTEESEESAPSRSRLGSHPQPKVLDFGLARITDAEFASAEGGMHTATGRIQGTLAYMSPEQARGERDAIDTRTDVYSLGVILYELLTGRVPIEIEGVPLPQAVRMISTQPPPRPREPAPEVSARESIKADLATIVLKALEKEPQRRYASAAALSDDIGRFLTSQPILARPASALYHMRKFAQRNRALTGGIAGTFLALLAGIAGTTYGLVQMNRQREHAENQLRSAERVAEFMSKLLEGAGPAVALGRDATMLREMLDTSAQRIVDGELRSSPQAEVRLRVSVGDTYRRLADYDSAQAMLAPVNDLARNTYGRHSQELAEALIATAALADARGDNNAALAMWQEALQINQALHRGDDPDVARCLRLVGIGHYKKGDRDRALSFMVDSLQMRRRLFPGDHPDVAESLKEVGSSLMSAGRLDEALTHFEQSLSVRRRLFPGDHPDVALSLNSVALCHQALGRLEEALGEFESVLDMRRRLLSGDHPDVSASLNNIASCLYALGRMEEALPRFQEALDVRQRLFPGDHPEVATCLSNVAYCLDELGRTEEALLAFQTCLAMNQRLFPGDHPAVADDMISVATCLRGLARADEALPLCQQAAQMRERLFKSDHPARVESLDHLAHCVKALDRIDEALPYHEAALQMNRRLYSGDHPRIAASLLYVCSCRHSLGLAAEALPDCEAALAMFRRLLPAEHPYTLTTEAQLGAVLVALDRLDEAEPLLLAGYAYLASAPGTPKANLRTTLEALVKLYEARDAAEPNAGHDVIAAQYRSLLEAVAP